MIVTTLYATSTTFSPLLLILPLAVVGLIGTLLLVRRSRRKRD